MRSRGLNLSQRGFSLIELLIALVIAALVIASVASVLARQQRTYRSLDTALQALPARHDAGALIAADIRMMLPALTPSAVAADSAFDLATVIGASSLCAPASGNQLFILGPETAPNQSLASWISPPDSGDVALVFQPQASPQWRWFPIVSTQARNASLCLGSLGANIDAQLSAKPVYHLSLSTSVGPTLRPGTPIRLVRFGRYNAYRASDGLWYIGFRRCPILSSCDGVQPLVGPLGRGTSSPVSFRFYDAFDQPLASGASLSLLARVDIVVRHERAVFPTSGSQQIADSTVTSIALRN